MQVESQSGKELPLTEAGRDAVARGIEAGTEFLSNNPNLLTNGFKFVQDRPEVVKGAVEIIGQLRDLGGQFVEEVDLNFGTDSDNTK